MTLRAAFRARLEALAGNPELARNSPHLSVTVAFDLPGGRARLSVCRGQRASN